MLSNDKTYIVEQLQALIKQQSILQRTQACNISALELAKNQCQLVDYQLKDVQADIKVHQEQLKHIEQQQTIFQQQVEEQKQAVQKEEANIQSPYMSQPTQQVEEQMNVDKEIAKLDNLIYDAQQSQEDFGKTTSIDIDLSNIQEEPATNSLNGLDLSSYLE